MQPEDRVVLLHLLTEVRVLSLGVLVDGLPHVGLLPFVVAADFRSALVHASRLARHTRGLQDGAPFSVLVHGADDLAGDPLQVPRVTLAGTVRLVARGDDDWETSRRAYVDRFPGAEPTFRLGDFNLYRLHFEGGRLVAGFARAVTLGPDSLGEL